MPIIPTDNAPRSILGIGASVHSTPADFGVGIGDALDGAGRSISQVGTVLAQVSLQKNHMRDVDWVGRSTTQLRNEMSKWLADPNNSSKETVAEDFLSLHKEKMKEYLANSPSRQATTAFTQEMDSFGSAKYEHALAIGTKTQLTNMAIGIEEQTGSMVDTYRSTRDSVLLYEETWKLRSRITELFGKTAPDTARQLDAQVMSDVILATMDDDPRFARRLLEDSKLEGTKRRTLENQIKQAEDALTSLNLVTLNELEQNIRAQAELGARPTKVDLTFALPYTSREHAQRLVSSLNAHIDAWNGAYDFEDKSRSLSGPEQVKAVNEFEDAAKADTANATRNAKILQIISPRVSANIAAFYRDPAGYMQKNNPALQAAQRRIDALPEPDPANDVFAERRVQLRSEYDSLQLKYQSPPTDDESPEEKKRHWVVPLANQRIISNERATALVQRINESSPNDAFNVLRGELYQHPGRESMVIQNLTSIDGKPGLRGEYWAVAKNLNNPNIQDLVGVLQKWQDFEKVRANPDKLSEYEDALDADPSWRVFKTSIPGDNFQNQELVSGYKGALMTYAMSQTQRGNLAPKEAIGKAVNEWINKTMVTISVNGEKMLIDRDQGKGTTPLTNDDATKLGRRLGLATEFLDPKNVAMTDEWGRWHFPKLETIGTEEVKLAELRRYIRAGFFKPSSDGKSATFYFRGQDGSEFEGRDKQGRAFTLDMASLPQFETYSLVPGLLGFGKGLTMKGLESDPLVPSVKQVGTDDRPGMWSAPIYRTNWPVEPKWLQRK